MARIKIQGVFLKNLAGGANLKNGQPTKDPATGEIKEAPDMSLKDVICTALLAQDPTENPQPDGEAKAKRFYLAFKIEHATEKGINLKSEDVSLIKTLVGRVWPPLVVGQTFAILEGETLGADDGEDDEAQE